MQSTMMSYPLTLVHLLERAGRCYPKTEPANAKDAPSATFSMASDKHSRFQCLRLWTLNALLRVW
jgi:hypothetical protein